MPNEPNHLPYQQWPFPCTYAECEHRFMTLKGMHRHKVAQEDHFYCRKCDVDCIDWQDLTRHKVVSMEPWITGEKHIKIEEPKHIVCEFCGEDFKSFGGRKRHRAQAHPADQDIQCPGCLIKFIRASSMIAHLETGQCSVISKVDFEKEVQQKWINAEIMKNPEEFLEKISSTKKKKAGAGLYEDIDSDSDSEDEAQSTLTSFEGGVSLLDFDERTNSNWPVMASTTKEVKNATAAESKSSAGSPAWTSGSTSKTLFPHAKRQPKPGAWAAILANAKADVRGMDNTNILTSQWWDPNSADYRVDRFWDEGLEAYRCPFPSCTNLFLSGGDLERHMADVHRKRKWNCPACMKMYLHKHALVAHSEDTMECRVRECDSYPKLLDQLSGGILKAEILSDVKIYNTNNNALIKVGDSIADGVMHTRYTAKMPHEK